MVRFLVGRVLVERESWHSDKPCSRILYRFLVQYKKSSLCMHAKSLQLCPTHWHPMKCSPPGSSGHGILQGKNTGVGSHALSREYSLPRDRTQVSRIVGRLSTIWATRQITALFLPRKFHGQRSLAGYNPGGSQRVKHSWVTELARSFSNCVCDGASSTQAYLLGKITSSEVVLSRPYWLSKLLF